jgi:phosphate transport system protein
MATHHTSRDFEAELRELRAHAVAMGARCERSLSLGVEAFLLGDPNLAHEVRALDAQINGDEMDIDALVLRVLALRQPVAYDLRLLTSALKLVTDLERIGDEALNIAERAGDASPGIVAAQGDRIREMATIAQGMVRSALEAFVEDDRAKAEEVLRSDDAVDALYGETIAAMVTLMESDTAMVRTGLGVVRVAKYIERIADHATNIAEEALFVMAGDDVRHGNLPRR